MRMLACKPTSLAMTITLFTALACSIYVITLTKNPKELAFLEVNSSKKVSPSGPTTGF